MKKWSGGGFELLGVQAPGVIDGMNFFELALLFFGLKKTVGLRVSPQDELVGLDQSEHGMASYPDFLNK
ncbi:MAG: hypothetical protein GXY11_02895 [Clostridiales bacterium]|nr:hypothetical protein [Clostridiales bacterium]